MTRNIYAICGSPRRRYNTDQLLKSYLKGVESVGGNIQTHLIYLYRLRFTGCRECMVCKLKGGKSYGKCGYPDEIKTLLDDVAHSDGIVFGTPVFFFEISAQLRAFIERLLYPFVQFKLNAPRVIAPKKIHTDFIYTMNVTEKEMRFSGYLQNFAVTENVVSYIFGYESRKLYSCYTYQYRDYSRYEADAWNLPLKKLMHEQQFPKDLEKAFQMGKEMALTALEE